MRFGMIPYQANYCVQGAYALQRIRSFGKICGGDRRNQRHWTRDCSGSRRGRRRRCPYVSTTRPGGDHSRGNRSEGPAFGALPLRCPRPRQSRASSLRGRRRFRQGGHPHNCAGRTKRRPTLTSPRKTGTHPRDQPDGTLRCAGLRPALERGYGRVVQIASIASFVALYEVAAYAASKAAVASLTVAGAGVGTTRRMSTRRPESFHRLEPQLAGRYRSRAQFLSRTPMKRFGSERASQTAVFLFRGPAM